MRGALPIPLTALIAGLGALVLFAVTPTGQAIIKGAIDIGASLLDIGLQLLDMTITIFSIMISLTKISFHNIHTISGLLMFVIAMIFWAVAGISIVTFTAWVLEKIRNILR